MRAWFHRWGEGLLAALCLLTIAFAAVWTRGEDLRRLAVQGAAGSEDETLEMAQAVTEWTRPVEGAPLKAFRGAYRENGLWRFDPGVCYPTLRGQGVRAIAAGVVQEATDGQVSILHAGDVVSRYAVLGTLSVRQGEQVAAGQRIGRAGEAGEIVLVLQRAGAYIDPEEMGE